MTLLQDATRGAMLRAIDAYARALAARKGVGLFYFAGHGLQLQWRNYLLPVDAKIAGAGDVAAQCVDMSGLLAGVRGAGNPMNVIILDACRDTLLGRRSGRAEGPVPDGRADGNAARLRDRAGQHRRRRARPTASTPKTCFANEGARGQDRGRLQACAPRRAPGLRRQAGPVGEHVARGGLLFRPAGAAEEAVAGRGRARVPRGALAFREGEGREGGRADRDLPAPLPQRALRGAGAAAPGFRALRAGREACRARARPGQPFHGGHRQGLPEGPRGRSPVVRRDRQAAPGRTRSRGST